MDVGAIVSAVGLSLLCAAVAVLLALPGAVALALTLARRRFRGKALVELLVMLPIVVPPVVTGYLLLQLLGRSGPLNWVGLAGYSPVFTWAAAALAQAVLGFPFMVLTLRVAFAGIDPELEKAAELFGASRWGTLWSVTLPLAWHGLAAGALLAFARALGEFGATIIVAGNMPGRTRTLPLAIYAQLQSPGQEAQVAALVAIAIGLACGALGLWRLLGGHHTPAVGADG